MRKIFALFFGVFIFFFIPNKAWAAGEFDISVDALYSVEENGITNVKQTVSIKNNTEFTYTPSYVITSAFKDIKNLSVYNASGSIPNILKENAEEQKSIEINFEERVVGLDRVNQFTVEFDTDEVATEKGAIWEVSIPGISDPSTFADYNITLDVPGEFGEPNIVKPEKEISTAPYRFGKEQIDTAGVYILFGDVQYYKLTLLYHIENTKVVPVKTEIALPPETSYQRVRVDSLIPEPVDVYEDIDGNWLAVYELNPREKMTVTAEIFVEVFSDAVIDKPDNENTLSADKYWEATDSEIQALASELKTPQAIYEYVVSTLDYDYEKVADQNIRIGAKESLRRTDFAVCLEFTDLFIALARAAGIPARSVEGYAFTDDSRLRPLSLVQDVLHSWPEYYDKERKNWIMVDPTWGNTTRGVDYFNSFDFDHIAFVVKGADSTYPIPAGGYKANGETKDVHVELADKGDFKNIVNSELEFDIPDNIFSGFPVGGAVVIKNRGNLPIEKKVLSITTDLAPEFSEYSVDEILPHGTAIVPIEFDKTSLLTNEEYTITIHFDGSSLSKKVKVSVFPDYFLLIVGGVISIGSITVAWAAVKTWRLYIQRRKK